MRIYPELHDAVLESVSMAWADGDVRLAVRSTGGPVTLVCSGVTEFNATHDAPWGPSASINEIQWLAHRDRHSLVVQMQSGDHIRVVCSATHARGSANGGELR